MSATLEMRNWRCCVNASKEDLEDWGIDVQKAVEQFDWIAAQFGKVLTDREVMLRAHISSKRSRIKEDIVFICENAYHNRFDIPEWLAPYACNLPGFDHMWHHYKCFVSNPYPPYPEYLYMPNPKYHGGTHHPDLVVAELGVKFHNDGTNPYIIFFKRDMPPSDPPFGWKFL